jgi:Diacylglycerol kinase catalytic domain
MNRQLAAIGALLFALASLVLAIAVAVTTFPSGIGVLACLAAGVIAAWYGITRRGISRVLGLVVAAVLLAGGLALVIIEKRLLEDVLILVGFWIALGCAGAAFAVRVPLPTVKRPRRPVLFFNPRSGGGKAERFHLVDEARARGIEPIELAPGRDLRALVQEAIDSGADGLAMAGGDGSQAIVAAAAAERDLPYACVPAGTRNHFALDLGVDRNDVVGALDAFVDGGERLVDLAKVNGRVFVNNVSLGLYAEAVQRTGYRDAKLRTLLDTVPDVVDQNDGGLDLRWTGPSGHEHASGVVILVSNNRYRLGRALGSGTRPRIDGHVLGVTVVDRGARDEGPGRRPWREWAAPRFEVDSDRQVAAGIDGEAVMLDAPLRFEIVPATLRVRIARQHPGASPSAGMPDGVRSGVRALLRIATGHAPTP